MPRHPVNPDRLAASDWLAPWHVYFIMGRKVGLIKIGIATRPDLRIMDMQTGSPDALIVLGLMPTSIKQTERALHAKFEWLREHGEWFRPAPAMLTYIWNQTSAHDHLRRGCQAEIDGFIARGRDRGPMRRINGIRSPTERRREVEWPPTNQVWGYVPAEMTVIAGISLTPEMRAAGEAA